MIIDLGDSEPSAYLDEGLSPEPMPHFEPATSAQVRYLAFLVRKSGRTAEQFAGLAGVPPEQTIKYQAGYWIDWLLREANNELQWQASAGGAVRAYDDTPMCGFDDFGMWEKPLVCSNKQHIHNEKK